MSEEAMKDIRDEIILRPGESIEIPLSFMGEQQPMWTTSTIGAVHHEWIEPLYTIVYEPETWLDKLWSWIWRQL